MNNDMVTPKELPLSFSTFGYVHAAAALHIGRLLGRGVASPEVRHA
jgi:hypothetical protein